MAALLRSARLLKFSPSGVLQVTGTKRSGPLISRFYGGALGGRRTGVCSRQISPASGNVASGVWPSAVGCVRSYAVATEEEDQLSIAVQSKQTLKFDWALERLDSSVRRTGRITKTLLLRIFHDICRTGCPSGNQALLLLRSCGSLLPEMRLEERTELAHCMWEKLQELGAQYDVSHYNALLKVYLQNEFKFSHTDFLAKMEAANVQPNRVTYQRLIAAYCQNGDIKGASTILGFMKSKDLPITEAVFNSLVMGHARAGDMDSAKNILSVMREAGIEPGPDTYVSLLTSYAEKGDMDGLKMTLEAAANADCSLMDRDIMHVIFSLAKAGHQQHVPEMVEHLRHERSYVPDAMNLCLSLITQNLGDTAFLVLKTFPTLQSDNVNDSPHLGNFFFRHCVNMDMAVEKITSYCKELEESNLHTAPLAFCLFCALEAKKTEMSLKLMQIMKDQDLPIRPHYFWPLLTQHVKDNNVNGVLDVVKSMRQLGVSPDRETLSTYVLPVFSDMEKARQDLESIGISVKTEGFLSSEVRLLAANNLAALYALLMNSSFQSLDLSVFRGSLIVGFKKSADVESMVKVTELLYKDNRFSKESKPAEAVSFFLYNLIDSMPVSEVQAQEEKLRKYFNQLHTKNITITGNIFRGIRNLLDLYNVPELIKDVIALVDPNEHVSASVFPPALFLEKKLAELKAENMPTGVLVRQTIQAVCTEENLQRALELKQLYEEEMTGGGYAALIDLCCRHDNVEEALNLKREISHKDSSVVLDTSKYIALVRALSTNDRVDDAVDILKEMREKDVVINDKHVTMLFHTLQAVVARGGAPIIRRLQDTIFTLDLAKPSTSLCSPLVTAYLNSKDLSGALNASIECYKRYKHLPRIHDILVGFVQNGDTEQLQKAMDFLSREQGEMTMLYNLFFAFLQAGRYREARKIIETPGLRARPGRLQWYAEKCIFNNQMEALEQMVDLTTKLFECDRDEMYSYVLRLCKETNDWQKAEAMWLKMQEENVIPRERTLLMLADILKSNGQEVPFDVPKTWYGHVNAQQENPASATPADYSPEYRSRVLALCSKGKAQVAYSILRDLKQGMTLGPLVYDHLIRALLAQGSMEEAMVVKDIAASHMPGFQLSDAANSLLIITHCSKDQAEDALEKFRSMLQADQVPIRLSVTKLVQTLGKQGDVAGIDEVQSLMKGLGTTLDLPSTTFTINRALAHIQNGDLKSAVELLEEVYTSADSKTPSMVFVLRKVLEDGNDKALDKLSAMAERLANHFACYRPALELFFQLLDKDKFEDAKLMLARCNVLAEQKQAFVSYLSQKSRLPGQVGRIKALLSLVPDFTEKKVFYTYLMKCHARDEDLPAAKVLYEQMQEEGIHVDELSLKRLALLYRNAGELIPFSEPPESFRFYADKLKTAAAKSQSAAEE